MSERAAVRGGEKALPGWWPASEQVSEDEEVVGLLMGSPCSPASEAFRHGEPGEANPGLPSPGLPRAAQTLVCIRLPGQLVKCRF